MKQALTVLTALAMLIAACLGCTSNDKKVALTAGVTLADVVESVRTELAEGYVRMPIELDQAAVTDVLGLVDADVEEFAGHFSMSMSLADCVAAIKAREGRADAVAQGLEQHRASVEHMFRNYLPQPYEAAKAGRVVQHGDYVFLLILRDIDDNTGQTLDRAEKIIDGYFAP